MSENSGGAGKYRGGLGIIRSIRITDKSEDSMLVSAATERAKYRPWGLEGGLPGGNASLLIYRDGRVISDSSKPKNVALKTGDVIRLTTAGGGGYGDPAERDPAVIRRELREGIVDEAWIREAGCGGDGV
jgi:N-methylhydantoinase B